MHPLIVFLTTIITLVEITIFIFYTYNSKCYFLTVKRLSGMMVSSLCVVTRVSCLVTPEKVIFGLPENSVFTCDNVHAVLILLLSHTHTNKRIKINCPRPPDSLEASNIAGVESKVKFSIILFLFCLFI